MGHDRRRRLAATRWQPRAGWAAAGRPVRPRLWSTLARLEAADELLDARDATASAGVRTAAEGVAELSAARAEAGATQQLAGAGVVMVAQGAEEIGAAEGMEASARKPKNGQGRTARKR